jgi:hypothetical protein
MVTDNIFSSYCSTNYELHNLVTAIRKMRAHIILDESLNNSYFLMAFGQELYNTKSKNIKNK